MRILLIVPDGRIRKLRLGPVQISFREAPLTMTTLASLIPPDVKASVRVVDECVESIPWRDLFDLVGITAVTGSANRAYQIADRYRANGTPVVLGGVHVTLCPTEAAAHADAVVIGHAEQTWPTLLREFARGTMRSCYSAGEMPDVRGLPMPARHLQKRWAYLTPQTVQATRGCRGTCDFCAVPAAGLAWQTRPVADVIDEIRSLGGRRFVFNDVSILEDREYAYELFTALADENRVWGALSTAAVGKDDELLDLMQRAGCIYLLIGFESVSHASLDGMSKRDRDTSTYRTLVDKLHQRGITVQGCFIFGLDQDTPRVFDQTVEMVNQLQIDIPRYAISTPFPGTPLFKRLKLQGRILHENWHYYDTQHVVFEPLNMTPEQLDCGFRHAYSKTFSSRSILRRSIRKGGRPLITLFGNLAYRLYLRELNHDPERFATTLPKTAEYLGANPTRVAV